MKIKIIQTSMMHKKPNYITAPNVWSFLNRQIPRNVYPLDFHCLYIIGLNFKWLKQVQGSGCSHFVFQTSCAFLVKVIFAALEPFDHFYCTAQSAVLPCLFNPLHFPSFPVPLRSLGLRDMCSRC